MFFINNLNRCYVKNKQGKIIGLVIILLTHSLLEILPKNAF